MIKLYRKSELIFSLVWIGIYCFFMSVGDILSAEIGTEKSVTLPLALFFSASIIFFLKSNGLFRKYGLCKSKAAARDMLFYIPLILLVAVNLLCEFSSELTALEAVLSVSAMLCVGFLEEIIFRGFLFRAMAENNIRSAVAVSSLTFGMGHILNLFNGSGAELIPNLLQVVYATAAGFMFVMIYLRTESLLPCIITHGAFNSIGVFCDDTSLTHTVLSSLALVVISGFYAVYLLSSLKKEKKSNRKAS